MGLHSGRGEAMIRDLELRITIGELLDSQTELFAERDALVHVEAGTRFTLSLIHI